MWKVEGGKWNSGVAGCSLLVACKGKSDLNRFLLFLCLFLFIFHISLFSSNLVLRGHTSSVSSVEFTSNGKYLVSGSFDANLIIWEVTTGKPERTIFHGSTIEKVAVSDNMKYIASVGRDKTLKIWDFETGKLLRSFDVFEDNVYSVDFSPDNRFVAAGSYGKIHVWRLSDFKHVRELAIGNNWARDIEFSQDNRRFLVATADWIYVWKIEMSGIFDKLIKRDTIKFKDKKGFNQGAKVYAASFSYDSQYFSAAGEHEFMSLWRTEDGLFMWGTRIHGELIWDTEFLPDNRHVATAGKDGIINILKIENREVAASYKSDDEVFDIAFSPDGRKMAEAVRDTTVIIREIPFEKSDESFLRNMIIFVAAGVLVLVVVFIIRFFRGRGR